MTQTLWAAPRRDRPNVASGGATHQVIRTGRSFLKWAGGKTWYAEQLAVMAATFEGRYVEPFSREILSDFRVTSKVKHRSGVALVFDTYGLTG